MGSSLRSGAKRSFAALGLLLAAIVFAIGCGSDSGGGGDDGDGTITIGASLPLTGEFSQPGKAAQQGYEVWVDMINENGGLLDQDVELIVKDDASDQNTVVADYNALIQRDQVDLLLGTFSSLLNLPASAAAERNRMLYIEPAGGAPEIFARDFQYGPFFTQQATADKQGDLFAEYILNLPEDQQPKTVAYATLDDPFTVPVVDALKEKFEAAGIETVYDEIYPISTSNFDTIASEATQDSPDMLINGSQFDDGIGFSRSLEKVGYDPPIFFQTNAPSFGEQYSDGIGEENTEEVFFAISHVPDASTPGNEEFVQAYKDKFNGEEPPEDAADAYAAGQVLQAAVEGVGSIDDQLALADWLRENEVETILGPLQWEDSGAPIGEFLIGQWQDGQAEIVLPPDAATSDEVIIDGQAMPNDE
ncbi:amino acid ABC transporter substrate-binding protein [Thermoleophilia bacterium SCSIO 60948]|nr:amino acid ABC transporter substrate-binding protein [Thermoleophilia bacterium SCSIO 60948]